MIVSSKQNYCTIEKLLTVHKAYFTRLQKNCLFILHNEKMFTNDKKYRQIIDK